MLEKNLCQAKKDTPVTVTVAASPPIIHQLNHHSRLKIILFAQRHPAMCVAVTLNPFHTCPALPPSHRIPSRWPPAPAGRRRGRRRWTKSVVTRAALIRHSDAAAAAQRAFAPGCTAGAERKDEEERSARAAASNGALAPESPFGRTAARERGKNMYIKVRGGGSPAACARTGESAGQVFSVARYLGI